MRKLIAFMGVLAGYFVIGASLSFIDWLAQFEVFGWMILTGFLTALVYLTIKLWRMI